jgi:hypothetical protein
MRLSTGLAVTALVALAACGKSGDPSGGNAAAGTHGSTAATGGTGGSGIRPGLYETTTEMKMSGLPPSMAKAMEGTKTTSRNCVTPEEANRPSGEIFSGDKKEGCESKDNVFAGGRIKGTLVCKGKRPGEGMSTINMDGTYGSDNYDVRTMMTISASGREMKMEGHTVGHRVGDCPAGSGDSK